MKTSLQILSLFILVFFSHLSSIGQNTKALNEGSMIGPQSITRTIIEDRNGKLWFASWEGILRYDGQAFKNITKEVSIDRFFAVLEDRKGNYWFASVGDGVYFFDGTSFQHFTMKEGLADDVVTNIYEDKDGKIWFGTEGGISVFDGKNFQNYTIGKGAVHNDVNAIVEDGKGRFWIATRGHAFMYEGQNFEPITLESGFTLDNIRHIIRDSKGNMWLAGMGGLWRYDGQGFRRISFDSVGYVYEDKKGNIWTSGTNNKGKGWALSMYSIPYLSYGGFSQRVVKTGEGMFFGITEDSRGNIWVGKLDGVYRFDGQAFEDFKK